MKLRLILFWIGAIIKGLFRKLKNKIVWVYKYLKARYLAKNSNWGKWIQRFCIALGGAGLIGHSQLEMLPKWSWLPTYLEYATFVGLIGAFLAQFSKLKEEEKANNNQL